METGKSIKLYFFRQRDSPPFLFKYMSSILPKVEGFGGEFICSVFVFQGFCCWWKSVALFSSLPLPPSFPAALGECHSEVPKHVSQLVLCLGLNSFLEEAQGSSETWELTQASDQPLTGKTGDCTEGCLCGGSFPLPSVSDPCCCDVGWLGCVDLARRVVLCLHPHVQLWREPLFWHISGDWFQRLIW